MAGLKAESKDQLQMCCGESRTDAGEGNDLQDEENAVLVRRYCGRGTFQSLENTKIGY